MYILIVLLPLVFFIVSTQAFGCSDYAADGYAVCQSHTSWGAQCTWVVNLDGSTKCCGDTCPNAPLSKCLPSCSSGCVIIGSTCYTCAENINVINNQCLCNGISNGCIKCDCATY